MDLQSMSIMSQAIFHDWQGIWISYKKKRFIFRLEGILQMCLQRDDLKKRRSLAKFKLANLLQNSNLNLNTNIYYRPPITLKNYKCF